MTPTTRLPLLRLTRTPRSLIPIAAWTLLAIVAASVERSRETFHAADHALLGVYGAFALPLLAYAIVGATLGGQGVARATRALVGFGATPSRAAGDAFLVAAAACTVLGGAVAALVCAIAHGEGDPPLAGDAMTTLWIGALGGLAYSALFMLGSSLGKSGVVRGVFLVLDWVLGSGTSFGALFTPRAHIRNLFGGAAPADLSQRGSMVALLVFSGVAGAIALLRARRAR